MLSTLHTNTAIGALTRLQDMGVEPFLLSSSLLGVIAQRLVRVLCNKCKQPYTPSAAECLELGVEPVESPTLYHAAGCKACNQNGYRGRTGIYEVVTLDESVRRMIHSGESELSITDYVRQSSSSIRDDGNRKVLSGVTTLEEVLRVTQKD